MHIAEHQVQLDEKHKSFEETCRRAASANQQHCLLLHTANNPKKKIKLENITFTLLSLACD